MNTTSISTGLRHMPLLLITALLTFGWETSLLAKSKPVRSDSESEVFWLRVAFVGSAHVKDIKGRAEYLTPDGAWMPLESNEGLQTGAKIRTLQNSEIVLQMDRSGSLVHIKPYTVVRLSPLEKDMDLFTLTGKEEVDGFTVRALRGRAQFRMGDGAWSPIQVNTMLAPGAEVKTSADANLTVFYAGTGLVLRVMPKSLVRLDTAPVTLAGQVLSNQRTGTYSGIQTAGIPKSP